MFEWIKSKVATIGLILGGILLALAGARAAKNKASAEKKEEKVKDLLASGKEAHLREADKLKKSAEKNKEKAALAKQKLKTKLEELGNANEDIDSVADRFNSSRVRRAG